MWQFNGWKMGSAILVGLVVAGVGGTCGSAATDWLGYSGFKEKVAMAQTAARTAHLEAEKALDRAEQNTNRIVAVEKDIAHVKGSLDRMEQNLYDYLSRQPGARPIPPPEAN